MNVLMSIAVIGSIILRDWTESATVVFLFTLAQYLEYQSMEKARGAVRSLMDIAPGIVHVRRDGEFKEVAREEVTAGEIIRIKPGERIPLDGIVVSGETTINQAPITGESMPVHKKQGDTVFAGYDK